MYAKVINDKPANNPAQYRQQDLKCFRNKGFYINGYNENDGENKKNTRREIIGKGKDERETEQEGKQQL